MDINNPFQDMNDKNFKSLSQGLKQIRAETTKNLERIILLEGTIVQLQNQVQILQAQNAVVMSRAFGTGTTE